MAEIKKESELKNLREGGKILAHVLEEIKKQVVPGVSALELDNLAQKLIEQAGGRPSFKGYGDFEPFPAALCVSVNDEVVHGIPTWEKVLHEGDIVGLDVGMEYPKSQGLFTDMAATVAVGKISAADQSLIDATKRALQIWVEQCQPGRDLNQIARQVQQYVEARGFSIIRDLVGHGVGYAVHEDPQIPNYYIPGYRYILKEGMVLAFEPMVAAGGHRIKTSRDGWTVVTADHSHCAHFEHTLLITKTGCEVITKI